jgi:hypothetical protein
MGWNGSNKGNTLEYFDGWYIWGIFDAGTKTLADKNIADGVGNYSSKTRVMIPRRP